MAPLRRRAFLRRRQPLGLVRSPARPPLPRAARGSGDRLPCRAAGRWCRWWPPRSPSRGWTGGWRGDRRWTGVRGAGPLAAMIVGVGPPLLYGSGLAGLGLDRAAALGAISGSRSGALASQALAAARHMAAVASTVQERLRLARHLHDELTQEVFVAAMELGTRARAAGAGPCRGRAPRPGELGSLPGARSRRRPRWTRPSGRRCWSAVGGTGSGWNPAAAEEAWCRPRWHRHGCMRP